MGDGPIIKRLTLALASILGFAAAATCAGSQSQVDGRLPTSCPGLAVMLNAEIDRMRKLQERVKKEEKAPPTDLVSAWQRTFGKKGDGVASLRELKKVHERADNLNTTLRTNGCATIDIDKALNVSVRR
jgi:hypothetical protein